MPIKGETQQVDGHENCGFQRQLSIKSPYLPCQTISLLNSNAKLTLSGGFFLFIYFLKIILLAMDKITFPVAEAWNEKWQ